jgi:hypothetical protein
MQVPKPSMTAVERAALEHEKRKALFRDRLGPQPADLYADMAETGPRPYHLSTFNAPLGSPLPSIAEVCAEQDRISRSLSERSRSHSGLAAEALEMERQHFLERTGPIPRTTTIVHTSHLDDDEAEQAKAALGYEATGEGADNLVIVGDHDPEWRASW